MERGKLASEADKTKQNRGGRPADATHKEEHTHIEATREKYFNNNTVILIKSQTNEQESLLVQNMRSRVGEVPLFQPIIQKG